MADSENCLKQYRQTNSNKFHSFSSCARNNTNTNTCRYAADMCVRVRDCTCMCVCVRAKVSLGSCSAAAHFVLISFFYLLLVHTDQVFLHRRSNEPSPRCSCSIALHFFVSLLTEYSKVRKRTSGWQGRLQSRTHTRTYTRIHRDTPLQFTGRNASPEMPIENKNKRRADKTTRSINKESN